MLKDTDLKNPHRNEEKAEKLKYLARKNPSFCPAAFREIYVDSGQRYRLCCHARPLPEANTFKENKTLPFEYFLSDAMEEIRNKMFAGEEIPECIKCQRLEKNTGTSYRHRYLQRYGYVDDVRNVYLKLRMFGNYCNLGCYMCHPYNSTTRTKELEEIYGEKNSIEKDFATKHFPVKYNHYNKIIQDIKNNIHLIEKIHMTGGETLLLPKYWEFVKSIPEEHSKHITLIHDTNLTEIRYKNHSVFDLQDKFKDVFFGVSCDHYGEKLKWIRYPINVNKFESNIEEIISDYKGEYTMRLNCTVSLLNIDDLEEIFEYYNSKYNIDVTFHNVVTGPEILSVKNLPTGLKHYYMEKYKYLNFVVNELKQPGNYNKYEQGLKYCDDLSAHRNYNFREIWKDFLNKVDTYK